MSQDHGKSAAGETTRLSVVGVERPAGEPMQIGRYRQLFLDDHVIFERANCRREFNQVEKADFNPILICDRPWERAGDGYYIERMSTVYDEDEDLLKMWYEVVNTFHDRPEETTVCYATSRDGIHWDKPNLGLFEFDRSKDNNIIPCPTDDRHLVRWAEKDPNETNPARKYKGLARGEGEQRRWIPKYSPDGFHWTLDTDNPTEMTYEDDCNAPVWDGQAGRWVFYRRVRRFNRDVTGDGDTIVRLLGISLAEGEDIAKWHPKTHSYVIMPPDAIDAAEAQRRGALWGEFYAMLGWPYEGIWIGGVEILWSTMNLAKQTGRLSHVEGYLDMHLAWSRNLIDWERKKDRIPFVPVGAPGAWDAGMIYGIARPVIRDDEIWFYYDGISCTHLCPGCFGNLPQWNEWMALGKAAGKIALHEWHPWNALTGSVGLAKLRLDGFAHVEGGHVPGILTTKPLVMTGTALKINADVDGGEIRVAILDQNGKPIPGYTLEDSDPFMGNSVRHQLSWKAKSVLSELKGRTVHLRFRMRRAKLYSFWFVDGGESSPSPRQRVGNALEAMPSPEINEEELPPWLRSKAKPTY